MVFHLRLIKGKKGEDFAVEDLPLWIVFIMILFAVMTFMHMSMKAVVIEKLSTQGTEHAVWDERILSAMSLQALGRQHNMILDKSKLTEAVLTSALMRPPQEEEQTHVFLVSIRNLATNEIVSLLPDKEMYENLRPRVRSTHALTKNSYYVLLAEDGRLSQGIIEIEEISPK